MDQADNREEGELSEEGELPEEADIAAAPEPEPDIDAPASQQAPPSEGPQVVAADSTAQTTDVQHQQQHAAPEPLHRSSREDRDRRADRPTRGAAPEHDRHRDHDKYKAEQEKAEIAQELEKLTRDISFQELRSNWEGTCQNMRNAIKKLDKLLRRVKKRREDDVELYPACYSYSTRLFNGLRHAIVICSTGLGKLADMEVANNLMRTAINYRHDVFSAGQKRELEQQLRDSKEFRALFLDRDRGRSDKAAAATGAAAGASGGSRGARPEGQQRVPLQRGQPSQQQQQERVQQGGRQRDRDREAVQAPVSGRSDGLQASVSRDEAMSEVSHAATAAVSSGTAATAAAPPSYEQQQPPAPAVSSGTAAAVPGRGGGQQSSSNSKLDSAAAAVSGSSIPRQQQGGNSSKTPQNQQQIRIVINSTTVSQPAAADTPPAAGVDPSGLRPDHSSGVGVKRSLPEVSNMSPGPEGDGNHIQAAKRAKRQNHTDSPGEQGDNGVVLSELPEVIAALENPSQLQVVLQQLLGGRRLCLVLDLDHTLVNSAKFAEVDGDWEFKLEQLAADQLSRPKELRDLHRLARVSMWTKLRPGVREFLRRAASLFELWIYTAGSKAYADAMVELLDPTGAYFHGRVIAQGAPAGPEDGVTDAAVFKRLMQGLEGREPVLLIVDDSSAVWPNDKRNLFVVERYIYFPSSRKRFSMQGRSLLEIDRDECPNRGMLMTAMRVFEHLHDMVFEHMRAAPLSRDPTAAATWDIRNIMASEKRQVLAGVHLVFSRVIPLEANPRTHPLWQLAEQFGATCGEQCRDETSHVVATHGGTEKVAWARQNNRFVVSPAWLECSCILWQRANEEKFPTPGS